MTRAGVVVLAMAVVAPRLDAQRIVYEGGLSATTGKYYFTERTTSFGLSTGIQLRGPRWSIRLSAPVWLQNTTLISAGGSGPLPTGGPAGQEAVRDSGQAREQRKQGRTTAGTDTETGTETGNGSGTGTGTGTGTGSGTGHGSGFGNGGSANLSLVGAGTPVAMLDEEAIPAPVEAVTGYEARLGDPILGATLHLFEGTRGRVSLGTSVKIPLASSSGLGTGQWDAGASLSMSTAFSSRMLLALDVSWWHLGDLDSLPLNDPVMGSLSVGTLVGTRWAMSAAFSGGTSVVTGFDPAAMVSLGISRLGDATSWGVSVAAGLTESSPDLAFSINWSVPLGRGAWP